jgi:Pectate lyase superfamily protein
MSKQIGQEVSSRRVFNVRDFGAVADSMTDDSPSIQNAINAAYEAGGGIVYLPAGQYYLNGGSINLTTGTNPGQELTMFNGLTTIPNVPNSSPPTPYTLWDMMGHNKGNPSGGHPTMIPNGPLLLFDYVVLAGDGPDQTVLLVGEQIYDGWIQGANGSLQSGVVIATANWWATYLSTQMLIPDDPFPDGFFVHGAYIRDLSIDCQGNMNSFGNAGLPTETYQGSSYQFNPAIKPLTGAPTIPVGQLQDVAIMLHCTQGCGVDNVRIYNGNVNGILISGQNQNTNWPYGPLPQTFQQYDDPDSVVSAAWFASTPANPNPGLSPAKFNVPVVNGYVTRCQIDMNYPVWLAGSSSSPGGSDGQLPVRMIGCANLIAAFNRIGERNQPSGWDTLTPGYPPNVAPDTNDAMDCEGAWHAIITGNLFTFCGDGVGADGNGDLVVSNNVMYNIGSVGFKCGMTSGKATSQTVITGNTIFLPSTFGSIQQAIYINDDFNWVPDRTAAQTATQGSIIISNNVIYGGACNASNPMIEVNSVGVVLTGNILDYGGALPQNQPKKGGALNSGTWPLPTGAGIRILGTDFLIEGNIFRNAGSKTTPGAIGISFPDGFGTTTYLPPGETVPRVLVKGNIFDDTVLDPISVGSTVSSMLGVRIIDNIGVNPIGAVGTASAPAASVAYENPFPYDCYVTVAVPSTNNVTAVTLNGVLTGATITGGNQKSFLVKAGGSIELAFSITLPVPTWTWVGL